MLRRILHTVVSKTWIRPQVLLAFGLILGWGLVAAGKTASSGYRITRGYYLYTTPPGAGTEGRGPRGQAVPVVMATGRLTTGQGVGFPGGATSPPAVSVVFDLLKDQPLDQIKVIMRPQDKWWSVWYVNINYRASGDTRYRFAGRMLPWSKEDPQVTVALHNQPARFVKITLRGGPWPHSNWRNMPLTQVIIRGARPPSARELSKPLPAPLATLASEFKITAPLVDRYGQYLYEQWPGKIHSDRQLAAEGKRDLAKYAHGDRDRAKFDRYGGVKAGPTASATGFFQLKKLAGRWWFITPEGHRYLMIGVDSCGVDEWGYTTPLDDAKGVLRDVFAQLPNKIKFAKAYMHFPFVPGDRVSFLLANLMRKYGAAYSQDAVEVNRGRLRNWGFNANAKWTYDRRLRLPYVTVLLPGPGARRIDNDWGVDPFDPGFPAAVTSQDNLAKLRAGKDDPWLVGYTFDSESGWDASIVQKALQANSSCAAKRAILAFLDRRYNHNLEKINAVLNTHAKSLADLLNLDITKPMLSARDVNAILRLASRRYYRIVSRIVRKYDPHHLLLGSALGPEWRSSEAWATGGRKYLDALSFDQYNLTMDWIRPYEKYGKPMLLLECGFQVSGHGLYASSTVSPNNQKTRGLDYRYMVEHLMANPLMVGFGWDGYYDEPVTSNQLGGENYNMGLVNLCDQPYTALIQAARKTNHRAYSLHAGLIQPVTMKQLGIVGKQGM